MIALLIGPQGSHVRSVGPSFEGGPPPVLLDERLRGDTLETTTYLLARQRPGAPLYLEIPGSRRLWPRP